MIALVKGTICERGEGYVVVETASGVGYRVSVSPASPFSDTLMVSSEVTLYTSHYLRENEEGLYGFASSEERGFFELLLTVSGVGPKLASTLVAVLGRETLAGMILAEDVAGIDAVPGIGRKMAERIIIDLRDKVFGESKPKVAMTKRRGAMSEEMTVVLQALERLGFTTAERERMVEALGEKDFEGKTVEDILKLMLGRKKEGKGN